MTRPATPADRWRAVRREAASCLEDVRVTMDWSRWRTVTWCFSAGARLAVAYRLERMLMLSLGRSWRGGRFLVAPLLAVLRPAGSAIDPHAQIGPGLHVLHPALGLVISGFARIGPRAVFVGGNCVGNRIGATMDESPIVIGEAVVLGANAAVIGPVVLGDRVRIGAGGVVVRDAPSDVVLTGVPARPTRA